MGEAYKIGVDEECYYFSQQQETEALSNELFILVITDPQDALMYEYIGYKDTFKDARPGDV